MTARQINQAIIASFCISAVLFIIGFAALFKALV